MKNVEINSKSKKRKLLWDNLVAYSFLLPSLVGVTCFSMIPLVISLYVSLTDWNYTMGIGNWNFIGLQNFIDLWSDEWFIASLKNTLMFTVVTVHLLFIDFEIPFGCDVLTFNWE